MISKVQLTGNWRYDTAIVCIRTGAMPWNRRYEERVCLMVEEEWWSDRVKGRQVVWRVMTSTDARRLRIEEVYRKEVSYYED